MKILENARNLGALCKPRLPIASLIPRQTNCKPLALFGFSKRTPSSSFLVKQALDHSQTDDRAAHKTLQTDPFTLSTTLVLFALFNVGENTIIENDH